MATEEQTFTTLAERIAALNQQKNFTTPPAGAGKKPPPPPPPTRQVTNGTGVVTGSNGAQQAKQDSAPPPGPRRTSTQSTMGSLLPPLPSRGGARQSSPGLPPRQPSAPPVNGRRNSNSSDVSTISANSLNPLTPTGSIGSNGQSYRKMAPVFDASKLPPLPPSRRETAAREEAAAKEARAALPVGPAPEVGRQNAARPSLPPRLPSRASTQSPALPQKPISTAVVPRLPTRPNVKSVRSQTEDEEPPPSLPTRRLPPPPTNGYRPAPIVPDGGMPADDAPPPIPVASRPSVAQIDQAISTKPDPSPNCLLCRDFTGPDTVAARHPTSTVPRGDAVRHLARVLCDPFPSATDKARAIFTWCHYNIKYDAAGFLGGNCFRADVEGTIFAGLSVCQGYAEVYRAVAQQAGLHCELVSGHGYGYGIEQLKDGESPPPESSNHAWNVVRIDNGQMKLIDACWGAGHIGQDKQYHAKFSPECFVASNEQFGVKHFPTERRHQYREDGRTLTWEQYYRGPFAGLGERVRFQHMAEEGISEMKVQPQQKKINVSNGGIIKFRFPKACPHWDANVGNKKPKRLFLMQTRHGERQDLEPVEEDPKGWWFDVPACELGAPGQNVIFYGVDKWNGQDARGLTAKEFKKSWGRGSWSAEWLCMAQWDLV